MSESTDIHLARILIVDDQPSNLRLLEYVLRRAGYSAVSSTSRPVEVCELHRTNRYDLILLDLQMPLMSGFEVLKGLKCIDGSGVAVLVLTADPSQMVHALEAGARSFLSKPFDLSEVLLRVRMMLEKSGFQALDETAPLPAVPLVLATTRLA